ncbi:MAG: hypothetical protein NZ827_07160 [Aquificaceae bacterium]|nr:hypothetical protein [Aquificaceae bacterium]
MENLLNFFGFLMKLFLAILLVGLPLLLVVIFVADKVYRSVGPRYEELRERRIRELEGDNKEKKKKG